MSILEIVLYSLIGVITLIVVGRTIYKYIKIKKGKAPKQDDEDE